MAGGNQEPSMNMKGNRLKRGKRKNSKKMGETRGETKIMRTHEREKRWTPFGLNWLLLEFGHGAIGRLASDLASLISAVGIGSHKSHFSSI